MPDYSAFEGLGASGLGRDPVGRGLQHKQPLAKQYFSEGEHILSASTIDVTCHMEAVPCGM